MTRPQRRAVALGGLVLDVASLLALAVAAVLGVMPARAAILPAVSLTIGITMGTAYLYLTRSRP